MSDVENAYKQIASFLNNETEKTLLICGIADEEKHRTLLKALNVRGRSKGLIFLIHTKGWDGGFLPLGRSFQSKSS